MKPEEINKRIFELSMAQGIRPAQLATLAGLSYNTIHRLELVPTTQVSLINAAKICRVIGITLNNLLTGEIEPESNSLLIATKLEELVKILKARS